MKLRISEACCNELYKIHYYTMNFMQEQGLAGSRSHAHV